MSKIMSRADEEKMDRQKSERITLRISLLRKGWSYRDLARRIKVHPGYIANLFCGHNPWWPVRAAINKALGEQIFTPPPHSCPGHKRPPARAAAAPASLPAVQSPAQ